MKEVLHKIIAFFMACVVVFSTMSFTISMHYCGDTLVDFGIFKQAKTCGMEMNESTPISDNTFSKKGCCTDKHITVKGQDELNTSFDNLTLHQQQFLATFTYTYINLFEGYKENKSTFSEYPPPLIVKSIYKIDETYLI
jgi:hypothetical protein